MRFLKKFSHRPWPQVALLLVGGVSLVAGVYRQETATVLTKAIYICLECIGIG